MATTIAIENETQTSSEALKSDGLASEIDGGIRRHLWTREDYYQIYEMGLLEGRRVELIHGEIVDMAPMAVPHAVAVSNCNEVLSSISALRFRLRIQSPFVASNLSELEPDLAVVERGSDLVEHPSTALLLIEVSDTTLSYDRRVKAPLYAAAEVQEYWILNLQKNELEVRRQPTVDLQSRTGYVYGSTTILKAADAIAPLFAEEATIKVSDLLP